jgi:signal transduction histidine kinase
MEERSLMMGGKYVIESEPGKGTTVKVTVPLKKKITII